MALPWLGLILGILLTVALVKYEPWDKNWESVKVTLFHEEALVPISGRWEITRVVRIDPAGKALIPERADSGIVTFGAGGTFQMQLSGRGAASTAKGLYNQRGGNLFLSNVQSSNKSMGFPSQALARAVRTNEYGLVLTFGNKESVFLRSLASGGAPGKFVRVGSAQAPRSRRSRR